MAAIKKLLAQLICKLLGCHCEAIPVYDGEVEVS